MKTKHLLIGSVLAIVILSVTAPARLAADEAATARNIATEFRAGEWNVDAGYLARTEDLQAFDGSTVLGLNYLNTRHTGVHLAGQFTDDRRGPFAEAIEFGLLGRLPVKTVALEFGLGAQFELKPDDWAVYAEAGPRWRIRQQIDLFAKLRGTRPIKGAEDESVALIVGAGTSF